MSDNQFPEDSWVQVRYPLTAEQERGDRAAWPWLPGWVAAECGPDEWEICVQAPELAFERDGETFYPTCYRDSSELRPGPEPEPGIGYDGSIWPHHDGFIWPHLAES